MGEGTAEDIRRILEREESVNPTLGRSVLGRSHPGGGVLWPPLEPTEASLALSGVVAEVTEALGWRSEAIARGGASDASNAAMMGVPAVCGLGPVTHGIHTDEEHSSIPALGASAQVATALLARLGELGASASES